MAITFNETPETVEDTQTEIASGRSRERDETQVALDTVVGAMVKEWESNGKPGPADAPRKRYTVLTADKSAFKGMIRRATTLHKVSPVWYKDVKSGDKTTIKFTIGPVPAKPEANGTAPAEPQAQAPAEPQAPAPAEPQAPAQESGRRGFARR